jgi:hypothetical protein
MAKEVKPMFSWRMAVLGSELDSTTKHVLLTLSCHMNEFGENCFPSIQRLAAETSLSRTTIIAHIKLAVEGGWIVKAKHGFGDQRWQNNQYFMAWPEWAQKGGQPPVPRFENGGPLDDEGGQPAVPGVVREVDPSSSLSTSECTSDIHARSKDLKETPTEENTEGHYSCFRTRWFKAAGLTPSNNKQAKEAYAKACLRFGEDRVLDHIEEWVDQRGGRIALKKDKWGPKNFLDDLEIELAEQTEDEEKPEQDAADDELEIEIAHAMYSKDPERRKWAKAQMAKRKK